MADCSSNNDTRTCTGSGSSVYPYSKTVTGDGDTTEKYFVFKKLTKDVTTSGATIFIQGIGKDGNDNGEDGKPSNPLDLTFTGDSYTVGSSSSNTLVLQGYGGKGRSGTNRGGSGDFGDYQGGHTGKGGAAGAISLDWQSGNVSDQLGFRVSSSGGDTGDAGKGRSLSGDATGGHSELGGSGGDLAIDLATSADLSISGGVLDFWSIGGTSGSGGTGFTDAGTGLGGDGGDGGTGGLVSVDIHNGLVKTGPPDGVSLDVYRGGIALYSVGGDGGKGGDGSGTLGSSKGGDGGNGGIAQAVTFLAQGTLHVSTSDGEAPAIDLVSAGGLGGKGGDGDTSIGTQAKGGDGGKGGKGGPVSFTVMSTDTVIKTTNVLAPAISLRSLGGSSGDGGKGAGGLANGSPGSSEKPGVGGSVSATILGTISTSANVSPTILGQSVGGFSGDAGGSTGLDFYSANGTSGGDGGTVTLNLGAGTIVSSGGNDATAVGAQSIGGGGGHGSSSTSIVGIGGKGSAGGNGGTVTVASKGASIATIGEHSYSILAQSIGGGGGHAGASSGVITTIGGAGGSGGDGGTVSVTNSAAVITKGAAAVGISAQSIGGGGGNARNVASGLLSIGGSGGHGGDGGTATLALGGTTTTSGDDATGVFVQSVGGGGGKGSNAIAAGVELTFALGGSGGDGGNGGTVKVSDLSGTPGTVSTTGARASALVAQSVGGGGGHGGYDVSANAGYGISIAVGLAGSGGDGGDGGSVTVGSNATYSTAGENAPSLLAQSIGGSGGNGGASISSADSDQLALTVSVGGAGGSGGAGGAVNVTSSGRVSSIGDASSGLIAQSIGGGGGNSGVTIAASAVSNYSLTTAVGQSGGKGGAGGDVAVSLGGTVTTSGSSADGVLAQSVGGGGGNAKTVVAGSAVSGTGAANLSIGGGGGKGGNAASATVTMAQSARVATSGDNAAGVIAQSIGGGGGNGSFAAAGSLASSNAIGFAIGGKGGASGNAGAVSVTAYNVTTLGDNSTGLLAQSISQSGGNGGIALTGSGVTGTASTAITIGGSGGDGGTVGNVGVVANGAITTSGINAGAILAQSIGGGGGNGNAAISASAVSQAQASVNVGGFGGKGGTAGDVTVTLNGAVVTTGDTSTGITAMSQGGSGGHGGNVFQGSFTASGDPSGSANVNVGGNGGGGGSAGTVTVTTAEGSAITTSGYASQGIFASSVGGSGGRGGSVTSGSFSFSGDLAFSANVSVGGGGGGGRVSDAVSVTNNGVIVTGLGNADGASYSDAIFAQSIGGDGGSGGNSMVLIGQFTEESRATLASAVGGSGGEGNHGAAVTVTNKGALTTQSESSHGIFAQSVGGSGGRGGNAASALIDFSEIDEGEGSTSFSYNVNVNVGGSGGSGGDGKAVSVNNTGTIDTSGTNSYGIYAQSVGGGGGDGGSVSGYILSLSTPECSIDAGSGAENCDALAKTATSKFSLNTQIGGAGKAAGDGGNVKVDNSGAITTKTDGSFAIFAQSTGGGGGNGGYGAIGTQALTTNTTLTNIAAFGSVSSIIYGNSTPISSASIAVGGAGGASGTGGDLTVVNSGSLTTEGVQADAIMAMSTGGGGGIGGTANPGLGGLISGFVGGLGSGGGDGGAISVTSSGAIVTSGDQSMGIFAQSVGGGGGRAGSVARFNSFGVPNLGVGVGGQSSSGAGGSGGDIAITLQPGGSITTSGENAHAIMAQSTGGGGGGIGYDGPEDTVYAGSFLGSAGDPGDGGDIAIAVGAPVTVTGRFAIGVVAQSASGSASDKKSSKSGDITIDIASAVLATGEGSSGIWAQSQGADSSGAIAVAIKADASVTGVAEGASTVTFLNGEGNTLDIAGTLSKPETDAALNAYVIETLNGGVVITNDGVLEGSVKLALENGSGGAFSNTLTNNGTFHMGRTVDLGAGFNLFNNAGLISPGTAGTVGSTTLNANFVQSTTGTLQVDFDIAGGSDVLTHTGSSATLRGAVLPNFVGTLPNTGDTGTFDFLTYVKGTGTNALVVEDTSTVEFGLSETTAGTVTLSYLVDYTPWESEDTGTDAPAAAAPSGVGAAPATRTGSAAASPVAAGVNANHAAFGDYVDELVDLRNEAVARGSDVYQFVDTLVFALLKIPTVDELLATYENFMPDSYLAVADATAFSALRFATTMDPCHAVRTANGIKTVGEDGSCLYFGASGLYRDVESNGTGFAYKETVWSIRGGAQFEFVDNWYAGFGVAYERSDIDSDGTADGNRYHLGGSLRREFEFGTSISAYVTGGFGDAEISRTFATPLGTDTVAAGPDAGWVSASVRAAQRFELANGLYLEPAAIAGVTYVNQSAAEECCVADYGLRMGSTDATFVSLNPELNAGIAFLLGGVAVEADAHAGVLGLIGDTAFDTTVQLAGARQSGSGFVVSHEMNTLFADLGAALSASVTPSAMFAATFNTLLSADQQEYGGSLRLEIDF